VKTASEMTYTVSGGALNSTQSNPATQHHTSAVMLISQLVYTQTEPIIVMCIYSNGSSKQSPSHSRPADMIALS